MLVCLVAFTLVMGALSLVVNASVPSVHGWLIEHVGREVIWAFFIVLWAWAGWTLYRGRKPKGT